MSTTVVQPSPGQAGCVGSVSGAAVAAVVGDAVGEGDAVPPGVPGEAVSPGVPGDGSAPESGAGVEQAEAPSTAASTTAFRRLPPNVATVPA
ncbi:hypothetical protein [Arthrobacter sp. JZ12]|uniref:hypothetical protein n=1 Tax=Arthrobacter sp. JZ12 TaxID=2654190 RepID=UPI002B4A81FE|nr:hypothetical protein [Arthrobacter sp. JZ12]